MTAAMFMAQLNPTLDDVEDVKTAVSEAVTNAIIHGYEMGDDNISSGQADHQAAEEKSCPQVHMNCSYIGRELYIEISDSGVGIQDVAEILQLKAQISTEKSKTKELYASIGVLYFKKHRDDENDEYQMFFPEIEKTLAHIAELEERVKKLEKAGTCPVCGASVGKNDAFCAKCGAPVENEAEEAPEEDVLETDDLRKLDAVEEQKKADPGGTRSI